MGVTVHRTTPARTLTTTPKVVTSTPSLLAAANPARRRLTLQQRGTVEVWFDDADAVAVDAGALLPGVRGQAVELEYDGALWGVTASGEAQVTVTEEL